MLKNLGFGYTKWILVVVSASLAQILFMPLWGKFIDKYGRMKAFKISGIFIPMIPLLWLASPLMIEHPNLLFAYAMIIEFIGGIFWAGFNLGASNFIYSAVTRERTAICFAYYSILQGFGVFIGATLGGLIASQNLIFLGMESILIVFLISGILRLVVYLSMISKIKEVRPVCEFGKKEIFNLMKFNSGKTRV
jgi:MFS family permease